MKTSVVAFTLIELLVVIAIVGILSGLIIVGMSSPVNNATLAKAQIFSSSLRNSLLVNLVSEWKLDEIMTTTTPDAWSSNNTCTLMGTTLPQLQNTGCVYDECLSFNGSTAYLNCGNTISLNITSALTVEAWVKTSINTAGLRQVIISRGNDWILYKYGSSYQFEVRNPSNNIVIPSGTNSSNNWLHIAGTYPISSGVGLYINGVLQQNLAQTGSIRFQNTATLIGVQYAWHTGDSYYNDYFFNGLIDEVRIYNGAIPVSKIMEHYYAGLSTLLTRGEIGAGEYYERIGNIYHD